MHRHDIVTVHFKCPAHKIADRTVVFRQQNPSHVTISHDSADKWQLAKTVGEVHAITNNEDIRALESTIIRFDCDGTGSFLVKQHAARDPFSLTGGEQVDGKGQSAAGIENIIHKQDVLSLRVRLQITQDFHPPAGTCSRSRSLPARENRRPV